VRLTSLTLTNYGVFQSERVDLDPAPGRINLLVAPNGAGKSILRSAFCDLLFGVGAQTPMGFRYGYKDMRLLAHAETPGGPVVFGRRKGQGNTLIDAGGQRLDPAVLAALLGSADRGLLERLFVLDTDRLRQGGQTLLESGGALAEALVSASGGVRQAREVKARLETDRDRLAPRRAAQTRPFYQALERFVGARKRIAATVLKPEVRERQEAELKALHKQRDDLDLLHQRATRRLSQLARVRRVRPTLAALDQHAAWLAAHPGAPVLPADAGARLDDAERALREAEQAIRHATETRDATAGKAALIAVDEALIEAGAELEGLVRRAGAMEKAAADRPARQSELDAATGRIAEMLRRLGAEPTDPVPPLPVIGRARRLLSEHDALRGDLDRLPRDAAAKQAERDDAANALAALPPPADLRALKRLVREVGADPAASVAEAARAVAQRRAALDQALQRVPGWTGGAEALAALRPLPLSEYERLGARREAAEQARARLADDLAAARADVEAVRERLEVLSGNAPIPDADRVDAARRHRDGGWALICRRLFESAPDREAERAWAGDLPLPLAYERAVTAADDLADRRGSEAERVERVAELRRQVASTEATIAAMAGRLAEAASACAQADAAWSAVCSPLNLPGDAGLAAVRELVAARERVLDLWRALAEAQEANEALLARHAGLAAQLSDGLTLPPTDDPAALPDLLARAEAAIDAEERAEKTRARLEAQAAAARRDTERLAQALGEANDRHARWRADWREALGALHRPSDEDPDVTRSLLDVLADLEKERQGAAQCAERLCETQRDMAAFRDDAAAAARRLAPDIAEADAFEIIQGLRRRLTEQQKAAQERDTLRAQLADAERELARLCDAHAARRAALVAALGEIGAEAIAAARERVALAAERARTEAACREAERRLRDEGDGLGVAALREEVASIPPDDMPAEIEATERERDAAVAALQDIAARIATSTAELDRQARETASGAAAAEQESAAASLGRVLDEATVLHLASLMLDTALGAVEGAGTSEVLERIGALFRAITAGAYDGVAAEAGDDGSARLVALAHGVPDEPKQVAQLSEGTRDQMFLALRVAAIEDYAKAAPPLPFIGDDILQTFDDERALAAMRSLTALSRTTQVVLLSHHRHLLDLAARLPEGSVRTCAVARAA
jgi:uncharacterized protein YhaN